MMKKEIHFVKNKNNLRQMYKHLTQPSFRCMICQQMN